MHDNEQSKAIALRASIAEISAAHEACVAMDERIRETLIAKINSIRSVGLMLQQLKSDTKTGRWLSYFAEDTPPETRFRFDARTASSYMRFAASLPHEVTSLPDGIASLTAYMRQVGALPKPGNPGERHPVNPFRGIFDGVKAITHTFTNLGDVGTLKVEDREQLKEQLRPIVEIYQELSAMEAKAA